MPTKKQNLTQSHRGKLYTASYIQINTFIHTWEFKFHFQYLCEGNHLILTFILKITQEITPRHTVHT